MNNIDSYNIVEQLKLNAYKEVQPNLEAAKEIIRNKKLAFGEQACVPFEYPDKTADPHETMLLIGYGGLDGTTYFFSNVLDESTNVSEAEVYVDDASTSMSVRDAFDYVMSKIGDLSEEIRKNFENTPYAFPVEIELPEPPKEEPEDSSTDIDSSGDSSVNEG